MHGCVNITSKDSEVINLMGIGEIWEGLERREKLCRCVCVPMSSSNGNMNETSSSKEKTCNWRVLSCPPVPK